MINGIEFDSLQDAVKWVSENMPEIEDQEKFVLEIQSRQSQGNITLQNEVLRPDPGNLQPVKKKFEKDGGIFAVTLDNGTVAAAAVEPFMKDGRMFFRVFLLNAEINKNFWHVSPESIPLFARTFIGMPFIDDEGNNPQNDGKRRHFGAEDMQADEILSVQEKFRKGNIFDIEIRKENDNIELFAIVETADKKLYSMR